MERVKVAYPDVFYSLDGSEQGLVRRYVAAMRGIDRLFDLQMENGFYPSDMSDDEFRKRAIADPELQSPYKLVSRKEGVLVPVPYRDLPEFRQEMRTTARALVSAKLFARSEKLPQSHLIVSHLKPQIEAFVTGNFDQTRYDTLVAGKTPDQVVVTGLFDRYMDEKYGLKYAWQGWVIDKNHGQTGYYNSVLQGALGKIGPGYLKPDADYRVVVGDVIDYGGLAALRRWSGQALPSEDDFRADMGTRSYIFDNRLREKLEEKILPTLLRDFPGVTEISGWRQKLPQAAGLLLVLHEGVGHSLAIQGAPPSLKELSAETWAQKMLLGLTSRIISPSTKRLALAVSLAWAKSDLDEYNQETDPQKRQVGLSYAEFAAMMFNYYAYQNGGDSAAIEVLENGQIKIGGIGEVHAGADKLVLALEQVSTDEVRSPGAAAAFIQKWSRTPHRFLESSGNPTKRPLSLTA